MRELKFRAWDVEGKCWIPEDKFLVSPDGVLWTEDTIDGSERWIPELPRNKGGIEYKLVQFTGLKDKNGREIYEGDILSLIEPEIDGKQTEFGIATVKFGEYDTIDFECGDISLGFYVEGFHGYRRENGSKDKYFKLDSLLTCQETHWDNGWTIIGNIYENPELVKP